MPGKKHILVVEDEPHLAFGIKFNLERKGYRVTCVGDGPAALKIVEDPTDPVDLAILDIMLPGMSGYAVCEAIRENQWNLPVLILSARTLSEDRTRGFDVGADQYMMKPFELDELLSRVKNLLTKAERTAAAAPRPKVQQYSFADAEIDFENHRVTLGGEPVNLTPMMMKLLQYFVANEGRLIPRAELLENVWEYPGHMNTRAPDQFLSRLRKIFEKDPSEPRHFLTIRDAGYRFVAKPEDET
jgi:two-component system OmpR family response regulator